MMTHTPESRRAAGLADVRYPLIKIEEREDGWYAVYSNGVEYRHDTEEQCRRGHRFDGHLCAP